MAYRTSKTLNAKQRLFVDHYIKTRNARQAAVLAGYSEHSAATIGPDLASTPAIKAEIELRLSRIENLADISVIRIEKELAKIAFAPISEGVKASDKNKSLELLGRSRKMFTEKQEISGPDGSPLTIEIVKLSE